VRSRRPHRPALRRTCEVRVRGLLAAARRHSRHVVLAGVVAGLLLGPAGPLAVLPGALLGGLLGGRSRLGLLAAAAVLGGALLATARLEALDSGSLASLRGRVVSVRAALLEPVRERPVGPAVARARLLDGPAAGEQAVLRIGSFARAGRWPEVGEVVGARGRVTPLGRADAYQRRRNAHAAIVAYRVTPTGARRGGLAGALDSVRRRAERGLATGLAPPEAALLRGMVLGEDERLSAGTREDFQRSGLAHILAVSGSNVMLLAALVLAACALTGVPLRARLLLAAAAIAVYVPLAGGGPSIQRAGVMGIAGLAAALAGRPARRWYALGLAAAATLAINPRTVGEPGWQLSFAAVAALLVAAPPLRAAFGRRMPREVADAAAITVAATLGTAPLMALYFGRVSLASLPANLLAAPAVGPIMWLGALAAAAAQVAPSLAAPFTALSAPMLVYVGWIAHATAALPFAAVSATPAALAAAVTIVAALMALAVHRRRAVAGRGERIRGRWLPAPALGVATLAAVVGVAGARAAGGHPPTARGELVVSFLDIGQGDATLLQLDGTAVLVDTGPPDGPILSRLRQAGVRRLDALVLTHAQADHEGAAPAVLRAFPTRLVIDGGAGWRSRVQSALPAAVAADRAREVVPRAGQTVTLGGIRLRILWPPAPTGPLTGDPNERAVVARAEAGAFSLLLTADAESDVTAPLNLQPVDALKVAHHGSADAGLPALLARLHPRVAAIEVGRRNTYGHPAPATLAALKRAVPTVVRTDRDGTVRLHVLGRRMWVER
jgi:competence protein ComEC